MTTTNAVWMPILRKEVANTSQRQAAKKLGISNAAVSKLLAGTYPTPERIGKKIEQGLLAQTLACPALGKTITKGECQNAATGPAPTHNPNKMGQWLICKGCANNQGVAR